MGCSSTSAVGQPACTLMPKQLHDIAPSRLRPPRLHLLLVTLAVCCLCFPRGTHGAKYAGGPRAISALMPKSSENAHLLTQFVVHNGGGGPLSGSLRISHQADDTLVIADIANHCIHTYTLSTNTLAQLSGVCGTAGSTYGANNVASFNGPYCLVYSSTLDKITVGLDVGVLVDVNPTTGVTTKLSGSGTQGYAESITNPNAVQFQNIRSVDYLTDRILVVGDPANQKIRYIDPVTGVSSDRFGGIYFLSTSWPHYVTVDTDQGTVYVNGNGRVWHVVPPTWQLTPVAGLEGSQGVLDGYYSGARVKEAPMRYDHVTDTILGVQWDGWVLIYHRRLVARHLNTGCTMGAGEWQGRITWGGQTRSLPSDLTITPNGRIFSVQSNVIIELIRGKRVMDLPLTGHYNDVSGNGHHVSIVGAGVSFTTNHFSASNSAVALAASATGYIELPLSAFTDLGDYTVCYWVEATTSSRKATYLSVSTALGGTDTLLHHRESTLSTAWKVGSATHTMDASYGADGWHHYCVQRDGPRIQVIADGATLAATTGAAMGTRLVPTRVVLGQKMTPGDQTTFVASEDLGGKVHSVVLFNYALNINEALREMHHVKDTRNAGNDNEVWSLNNFAKGPFTDNAHVVGPWQMEGIITKQPVAYPNTILATMVFGNGLYPIPRNAPYTHADGVTDPYFATGLPGNPKGIAYDTTNSRYVVGCASPPNRLATVSQDGATVNAGFSGNADQAAYAVGDPDTSRDGAAAVARYSNPVSVASFDVVSYLVVDSTGFRIRRVMHDGSVVTIWTGHVTQACATGEGKPQHVVVSDDGDGWVTTFDSIVKVASVDGNPATTPTVTFPIGCFAGTNFRDGFPGSLSGSNVQDMAYIPELRSIMVTHFSHYQTDVQLSLLNVDSLFMKRVKPLASSTKGRNNGRMLPIDDTYFPTTGMNFMTALTDGAVWFGTGASMTELMPGFMDAYYQLAGATGHDMLNRRDSIVLSNAVGAVDRHGRENRATYFTGAGGSHGEVTTSNSPLLGASSFTVCFWHDMAITDYNKISGFVSMKELTSSTFHFMLDYEYNFFNYWMQLQNPFRQSNMQYHHTGKSVEGGWTHLCVVRDGTHAQTMVNGNSVGYHDTGHTDQFRQSTHVAVAYVHDQTTPNAKGRMSDLVFHNYAMTDAEVRELMDADLDQDTRDVWVVHTLAGLTNVGGTANSPNGRVADVHPVVPHGVDYLFCEWSNACIRRMTDDGVVTSYLAVCGAGSVATVMGTGTSATISGTVTGLLYDSTLQVHVLANQVVLLRVTPSGTVGVSTLLAGSLAVVGHEDKVTGVSGGKFRYLLSGAMKDASTYAYPDQDSQTVREISSDGDTVTTVLGKDQASGFKPGVGTAARLTIPYTVTFDGSGNGWITSSVMGCIARYTPTYDVTFPLGRCSQYGDVHWAPGFYGGIMGSKVDVGWYNPYTDELWLGYWVGGAGIVDMKTMKYRDLSSVNVDWQTVDGRVPGGRGRIGGLWNCYFVSADKIIVAGHLSQVLIELQRGSLRARYPLVASGGFGADTSGNRRNMVSVGTGITSTTNYRGLANQAAAFDGTTNAVGEVPPEVLDAAASYSVCFFLDVPNTDYYSNAFSITANGAANYAGWKVGAGGWITYYHGSESIVGANVIPTHWQHYCAVKDGVTLTLYKDASSQGTVTAASTLPKMRTTQLVVGQSLVSPADAGLALTGSMSDLVIYNYALTEVEMMEFSLLKSDPWSLHILSSYTAAPFHLHRVIVDAGGSSEPRMDLLGATGFTVTPSSEIVFSLTFHCVYAQATDGRLRWIYGKCGAAGSATGYLYNAAGIAYMPGSSPEAYILCDMGNARLVKLDTNNGFAVFSGLTSTAAYAEGTAVNARYSNPEDIKFLSGTDFVMADYYSYRLRLVDTSGTSSLLAGNGAVANTPNAVGTSASINGIRGIDVDPTAQYVYVATHLGAVGKIDLSHPTKEVTFPLGDGANTGSNALAGDENIYKFQGQGNGFDMGSAGRPIAAIGSSSLVFSGYTYPLRIADTNTNYAVMFSQGCHLTQVSEGRANFGGCAHSNHNLRLMRFGDTVLLGLYDIKVIIQYMPGSLVAKYDMVTPTDGTGNGHTLSPHTTVDGQFAGTTGSLSVVPNAVLDGASSFTFCGWIMAEATNLMGTVISVALGPTSLNHVHVAVGRHEVHFSVGTQLLRLEPPPTPSAATGHWCFGRNGRDLFVTFNGIRMVPLPPTPRLSVRPEKLTVQGIVLGQLQGSVLGAYSAVHAFNGRLEHVSFYNYALSPSELYDLFADGRAPTPSETASVSASDSLSATPTMTHTATATATMSSTATITSSSTQSTSATSTNSAHTLSATQSVSTSQSQTATVTRSSSASSTETISNTKSTSQSHTRSGSPTPSTTVTTSRSWSLTQTKSQTRELTHSNTAPTTLSYTTTVTAIPTLSRSLTATSSLTTTTTYSTTGTVEATPSASASTSPTNHLTLSTSFTASVTGTATSQRSRTASSSATASDTRDTTATTTLSFAETASSSQSNQPEAATITPPQSTTYSTSLSDTLADSISTALTRSQTHSSSETSPLTLSTTGSITSDITSSKTIGATYTHAITTSHSREKTLSRRTSSTASHAATRTNRITHTHESTATRAITSTVSPLPYSPPPAEVPIASMLIFGHAIREAALRGSENTTTEDRRLVFAVSGDQFVPSLPDGAIQFDVVANPLFEETTGFSANLGTIASQTVFRSNGTHVEVDLGVAPGYAVSGNERVDVTITGAAVRSGRMNTPNGGTFVIIAGTDRNTEAAQTVVTTAVGATMAASAANPGSGEVQTAVIFGLMKCGDAKDRKATKDAEILITPLPIGKGRRGMLLGNGALILGTLAVMVSAVGLLYVFKRNVSADRYFTWLDACRTFMFPSLFVSVATFLHQGLVFAAAALLTEEESGGVDRFLGIVGTGYAITVVGLLIYWSQRLINGTYAEYAALFQPVLSRLPFLRFVLPEGCWGPDWFYAMYGPLVSQFRREGTIFAAFPLASTTVMAYTAGINVGTNPNVCGGKYVFLCLPVSATIFAILYIRPYRSLLFNLLSAGSQCGLLMLLIVSATKLLGKDVGDMHLKAIFVQSAAAMAASVYIIFVVVGEFVLWRKRVWHNVSMIEQTTYREPLLRRSLFGEIEEPEVVPEETAEARELRIRTTVNSFLNATAMSYLPTGAVRRNRKGMRSVTIEELV